MNKVHRSHAAPEVKLPVTIAIGCTGDRIAPDEEILRGLIAEFLSGWQAHSDIAVYGLCTLGGACELIFAETCIDLEIPLQILSPLPADQLLALHANASPQISQRAAQLVQKALSFEVVASVASPDGGFYECGIETAQRSSLLIVLCEPDSSGESSTSAVAAFAEKTGLPIARPGLAISRIEIATKGAEQKLLRDPQLDFLNSLPDRDSIPLTGPPTEVAKQWFRKIDANATVMAPQVRRLSSIPILYTAAAAVISGAASKTHAGAAWLAIAASAVLGIVGAVLPLALHLSSRQALWARTRITAEVCRSALALWDAPSNAQVIGSEVGSELTATLASLRLLRMKAAAQSSVSVEQFKQSYREERILGQIAYFSRQAGRADQRTRRYRLITLLASAIAVLLALGWLADKLGSARLHGMSSGPWFPLTLSALFQSATVLTALGVVHDSVRRKHRYKDLCETLSAWDRQIQTLRSWAPVLQVAIQVEKSLMVELLEWQSLVRNTKLTGK